MQPEADIYTHPELNAQVTAIGGTYVFTGEQALPFQDQQVLVFTGYAVLDTACCGAGGGCTYALVPGFIDTYRCRQNDDGKWLSRVRYIRDAAVRQSITARVLSSSGVQQVQFLFSP